ncbi:MAG: hypothetical protein ACK4XK_11280, partial [Casimicrobiaceae bacterium]
MFSSLASRIWRAIARRCGSGWARNSRRQSAPPPAAGAFGADDPAAQLDRLIAGQPGGEDRIGGV